MKNGMVIDVNVLINKPDILNVDKYDYYPVITKQALTEVYSFFDYRKVINPPNKKLEAKLKELEEFLIEGKHLTIDKDLDSKYIDDSLVELCVENNWKLVTYDLLLKVKAEYQNVEVMYIT